MLGPAADVEPHPVEQFAVQAGMAREQRRVVQPYLAERLFRRLDARAVGFVNRIDTDQHQHSVGSGDNQRRTFGRDRGPRGAHPSNSLQRLDATGVGFGKTVAEGQRRLVGGRFQSGGQRVEAGSRLLQRLRVQLGTGLARRQLHPAGDQSLLGAGDLQHRDAVGPRDEQPPLEGAPIVGPMNRRFAGLEIDRPHVIRHFPLGLHLDPQVERGDERIGIHEPILPGKIKRQLRRLLVLALVDQGTNVRQPRRGIGRHDRFAHRQKHPFVGEDNRFMQRSAQYVSANRAVAAD